MKPIRTPQVYVIEGSTEDKCSSDRLERMMEFVRAESVRHITLEELDQIAAERRGRFGEPANPHVVFTKFRWRTPAEEDEVQKRYPHLRGSLRRMWGAEQFQVVGGFSNPWDGAICHPLWDTTPAQGCPHACAYCGCIGPGCLYLSLNVEELIARHHEMMRLVPWQKNWHTGGATDLFCFEPEYGFVEQLLDRAARLDRYVLFYTSSDRVEFLLELANRDRAIVEWTISPQGLTRFERKAPPLRARLDAMRRCKDAGCTVRCQFSPLIPLAGWQEEYRAMLRELFDTVEPDLVAAHMLRCPRPVSQTLQRWFGESALDPEYLALVDNAERDGGQADFPGNHIFPYEARAKLYRFMIDQVRDFDPDVPFALCRETPDMWDEFEGDLRLSPADCACGTGPRAQGAA